MNAVVDAESDADFQTTCIASRDVADFMRRHGFYVSNELKITVTESISDYHQLPVFGQFNTQDSNIVVLSLAACKKVTTGKRIFGQLMNEVLHQSFIAHEVAHAVADQNFRISRPSLAAHEYIAYSVQLATMPAPMRGRILKSIKLDAFEKDKEINETYLNLNPEYFGVKSYLHFMKAENGTKFYRKLLSTRLGSNGDLE